MAKVLVTDTYLSDIADAIRSKLGVQTTYTPSQMAAAIASIPTGITPTGELEITENGTYDVTQYASVTVNVSGGSAGSDAVHIWTSEDSTSGNPIIKIQAGKYDESTGQFSGDDSAVSVVWNTVPSDANYYDIVNIRYSGGWNCTARVDCKAKINNGSPTTYSASRSIYTWGGGVTVDIVVWIPES